MSIAKKKLLLFTSIFLGLFNVYKNILNKFVFKDMCIISLMNLNETKFTYLLTQQY